MKLISNSTLAARDLMFAAVGAFLCGFVSASPAVAQAGPPSSEQVIITSPYVVRQAPAPANRAAGLRNPELISVTRAVSYADLDLSKAVGVTELQTRVRNTARDVCAELNRLYPRTGGQYIYSNTDCVKKATDDGMEVVKQVAAVATPK